MWSWTRLRRIFILVAGTVLVLHFSLLYFFLREQLALQDRLTQHSHEPYYLRDAKSPLELNPDTNWGADVNIRPMRHLEFDARENQQNDLHVQQQKVKKFKIDVSNFKPEAFALTAPPAEENTYQCLSPKPPPEDMEEPLAWQDVVPGQAEVYSAFLETKAAPIIAQKTALDETGHVVVIGTAGPGVIEDGVFHCQVWYRGVNIKSRLVQASAKRLLANSSQRWSDVFFYCPVNPYMDPMSVSIINRKKCAQVPPNWLFVRNIDEVQGRTNLVNNFTVCIPPLRDHFSNTQALVETVELNLLLGAGRVILYDQETTGAVRDIFESYKSDDSATVIPWTLLPPFYYKVSHSLSSHRPPDYARLSALNDCLFRFRFVSRYLLFVDLEEFVIPRTVRNWDELFSELPDSSKRASVLRFSRVPFLPENSTTHYYQGHFSYSASSPERQHSLLSQLNTRHLPPLSPGVSSTLVVQPTLVDIVNLHNVISKNSGATHDVDPNLARLHDYFYQPPHGGSSDTGSNTVSDKRALIYNEVLKKQVSERHRVVRGR